MRSSINKAQDGDARPAAAVPDYGSNMSQNTGGNNYHRSEGQNVGACLALLMQPYWTARKLQQLCFLAKHWHQHRC